MTLQTCSQTRSGRTMPSIVKSLDVSIDQRIRRFINGQSDGSDVLDALYGDIAAERIPARLSALLSR